MAVPWYLTDFRLMAVVATALMLTGHCDTYFYRIAAWTTILGSISMIAFYYHNVRLVFNVAPSPLLLKPLFKLARIARPLETLFRLMTAPLRDRPDIYILGETRCGTTTLASLVRSLPGAQAPFCPWIHPLANKESFYHVGHYYGVVHPLFAGAPYPFIFWRWLAHARGQPYFCFDASAQYLSAPWVPRLVHKVAPNAVLIACVREPVAQAVSWWRFECHAMDWAATMGLDAAPSIRGHDYPPPSLFAAFTRAMSQHVRKQWAHAATSHALVMGDAILPPSIGTTPGGQLASIGIAGCYFDSLIAWERVLRGSSDGGGGGGGGFDVDGGDGNNCRRVMVVELDEELALDPQAVLRRIVDALSSRNNTHTAIACAVQQQQQQQQQRMQQHHQQQPQNQDDGELLLDESSAGVIFSKRGGGGGGSAAVSRGVADSNIKLAQCCNGSLAAAAPKKIEPLNSSQPLSAALEPTMACRSALAAHFQPHNEKLFRYIGRRFKWHDRSYYTNLKPAA